LPVRRRPVVAILGTGDELRPPGEALGPGEIHASNAVALAVMLECLGAVVRVLPRTRDDATSLALAFELAAGCDLLVTIGGASVGDHDLIAPAARAAGLELRFRKVAMRPGKPLMAGAGRFTLVGLPGNPVSAIVCAEVFLRPMLERMRGAPDRDRTERRVLAAGIDANGPRQHYMRASILPDGTCRVADRQDSNLLSVLARSDCLAIRPPGDPARGPGDAVRVLPLDR
jgi:molybdopterin molybdotransferase